MTRWVLEPEGQPPEAQDLGPHRCSDRPAPSRETRQPLGAVQTALSPG